MQPLEGGELVHFLILIFLFFISKNIKEDSTRTELLYLGFSTNRIAT